MAISEVDKNLSELIAANDPSKSLFLKRVQQLKQIKVIPHKFSQVYIAKQ